jgi:hypothetical protein
MKYLVFKDKVVDKSETGFPVSPEMQWVNSEQDIGIGYLYENGEFISPDSKEPIEVKSIKVRNQRDSLLSATDWLVVKNMEATSGVSEEWKVYRQRLRDLPQDPNFPNVDFPVKPE